MDIRLEFLIGMALQLSGLALLAYYFGLRMTRDRIAPARACLVLTALSLVLLGIGLQIFVARQ
jgi:hypothetical protein